MNIKEKVKLKTLEDKGTYDQEKHSSVWIRLGWGGGGGQYG